ncbi:MAG: hypothetical protein JWN83_859 [Chitinophagaceae bacterium]|nr:hypothetical protein [Chitinophagaceae bacterium]
MRNKKSFILIFTISGLIMILSRCINSVEKNNDPRGDIFIGSASCRQCHKSIYDSYVATSHFNSTKTASDKNILGSFTHGQNTFVVNSATQIVMEHRDSGLFQVLYVNGKEAEIHRMDITFGIKHAQTFLYWQGNKTFELPISYYTTVHTWASSPAYPSVVNFTRSIGIGCFECHSSYIEGKLNASNKVIEEVLDKNSLINGIDCERCHGPSTNHVNYHLTYPEVKQAKYIVTSNTLSRQQKLDVCAVCHSGNDKKKEISAFKFKMGDTLANFFLPWASHNNTTSDFDVHGNQYQLLSQSKCFLQSKTMDCLSCHNPHTNAGTDVSEYSKKCLSCHKDTDHSSLKMDEAMANTMKANCIDCHMPLQPSRAITFQLSGSDTTSFYLLRTHKIAVYRDEKINNLLQYFKKNKNI